MAEGWAEELRAMYRAWFAASGLSLEDARRKLLGEHGAHRLVDVGPAGRRETAFAVVAVEGGTNLGESRHGIQVRTYVRQPYRLVKDLRSGVEVEDVDGVLAGDLWPFLEAGPADA